MESYSSAVRLPGRESLNSLLSRSQLKNKDSYTSTHISLQVGRGSSVSIATGYRLDGPGIESRWVGRDFPHLPRPVLWPTQPPVQWVTGLSRGVESSRGVTLTPQPLLLPWSRKSRAIPIVSLWAVRSVQSLSACTRVHFTLLLYMPS
jgi:hypothetical protein